MEERRGLCYLWAFQHLVTTRTRNTTSHWMKEQIRQLIASGNTENALELLAQGNGDALLLQAQFNSGKKNFNMGLVEHSEWQRIQARVNFAALEMAAKLPDDAAPKNPVHKPFVSTGTGDGNKSSVAPTAKGTGDGRLPPKVFISYNHKDGGWMRAIKRHLEEKGIQVLIDLEGTTIGASLKDFVNNALKNNTYILAIISENSLLSAWVNKELKVAILSQQMGNKRLIPIRIDNALFDDDFFFESNRDIDKKIKDLRQKMIQALNENRGIGPFQEEFGRQRDLKNNLRDTIQMLKDSLVVDLSDNEKFESNMDKVVQSIHNGK